MAAEARGRGIAEEIRALENERVDCDSIIRQTTSKSWDFERFDSEIEVHKDGSFTVRETQVVNFHGSFTFLTRDLTTQKAEFSEGRTFGGVRVSDIQVYELDGTPYERELWKVENHRGGCTVRIQFQAKDEQRGWIISYRMSGAMIYADDYDRLYWNAVSQNRSVPIKHARVTVQLPTGSDLEKVETTYYTYQNTQSLYPGQSASSGLEGELLWWEMENLHPYQVLTIDVAMPKGIVEVPFVHQMGFFFIMLAAAVSLFLAVLGYMMFIWYRRGRDERGTEQPLVSFLPPKELSPAALSFLVEQNSRMEELPITVVDLAVRGKLKIVELQDEKIPGQSKFRFIRKDSSEEGLLAHEREVMKGLFKNGDEVSEDELKLFETLIKILKEVKKEVKERKLFYDQDPEKVTGKYFWRGFSLAFFPSILLIILLASWIKLSSPYILLAGIIPAGIAVMVVGNSMPKRTAEGSRILGQALAFKEYLSTAERGELESMTVQNIQENLPYAMALGIAEEWARKFQGILVSQPDWYQGLGSSFSSTSLVSRLEAMSVLVVASAIPHSSSSGGMSHSSSFGGFGGGSSGGGFGGGGSSAG